MDEVQYMLTRDDMWRYQLYVFKRQQLRTIRVRLIFIGVLLVGAFAIFAWLFAGNYGFALLAMVFVLLISLFFILLFFGLMLLLMRLGLSRSNEVLGKRGVNVLTINEQGVQQKNEISNGTTSWQAFRSIEEDKHNIYLVTDQPGRLFMAHVIPKRIFESPDQTASFMARAQNYWQEQTRQVITSHL